MRRIRKLLEHRCPGLGAAQYSLHGKYLGQWLGPDASDELNWRDPCREFARRGAHTRATGLSLAHSVAVYNCYDFPVLSFIAQSRDIPSLVWKTERSVVGRLTRSPHNAVTHEVLLQTHSLFRFPRIQDLRCVGIAAKARAWQQSEVRDIVMTVISCAMERKHDRHFAHFCHRFPQWRQCLQATQQLEAWYIVHTIGAAPVAPCLGTDRDRKLQRRLYDACVNHALASTKCKFRRIPRIEHILADRRKGWDLDVPREWFTTTVQHLTRLGKMGFSVVPTCVLRTLCNGWHTQSRIAQSISPCVFGCVGCVDRLEHYLHCPVVSRVVSAPLGLVDTSVESRLLLSPLASDHLVLAVGMWHALAYFLFSHMQRCGGFLPEEVMRKVLAARIRVIARKSQNWRGFLRFVRFHR